MATKTENTRIYARVSGDLTARIGAGEFEVGARLPPERELAQTYGVSRPTIREAVIALEVDGLVETRQGSGVYVVANQPRGGIVRETDIGPYELLEARRAFEGEAAALAAARINADELAELELLVASMHEQNLRNEVTEAEDVDRRFHILIASASRNSAVLAAVEDLWSARTRSPQHRLLDEKAHAAGSKPRTNEHRSIIDALRKGDPDVARSAMRAHLSRVLSTLLSITEIEEVERARERTALQRRRFSVEDL